MKTFTTKNYFSWNGHQDTCTVPDCPDFCYSGKSDHFRILNMSWIVSILCHPKFRTISGTWNVPDYPESFLTYITHYSGLIQDPEFILNSSWIHPEMASQEEFRTFRTNSGSLPTVSGQAPCCGLGSSKLHNICLILVYKDKLGI